MASDPDKIVTGRVLAAGSSSGVPSTRDDPAQRDYTGELHVGVLWPNNMVLNRSLALALGGFDETFGPGEPAEDCDFCYRWLRTGHRLLYEPDLQVWHRDWRTREELERVYLAYGRGLGFFYAKHLRAKDKSVIPFLAGDVYQGMRGTAARLFRQRPRWSDPRQGLVRGLASGFVAGWRVFRPNSTDAGVPPSAF